MGLYTVFGLMQQVFMHYSRSNLRLNRTELVLIGALLVLIGALVVYPLK